MAMDSFFGGKVGEKQKEAEEPGGETESGRVHMKSEWRRRDVNMPARQQLQDFLRSPHTLHVASSLPLFNTL